MTNHIPINTPVGEVRLPVLFPSDFIKLAEALATSRKAKLLNNAQLAGISGGEIVRLLNQFDARPIRYGDVVRFMLTLEGQAAVLRLSLRHDNPGAGDGDVDALGIDAAEWLPVAARLANLKLEYRPTDAGKDGDPLFDAAGDDSPSGTDTGGEKQT